MMFIVPLQGVLSFTFMRRAFCAVALLALAFLLPRALRVGLAGDSVDAVGRITAQDEAIYAHSAISTVAHGDWLTPYFLDRLTLNKPPMPVWLEAASARAFGVGRLALRLPVLILSASAVGFIFLWGAESAGVIIGACAALLLLGNHLFHTPATLGMADGVLAAITIAAMYCVYADPWLESRAAFFGYTVASAAAILTKGVEGLLPVAVLLVYWVAVRPRERPRPWRGIYAIAVAGLLASPWFLYHLAIHTRWFWTDHRLADVFESGASATEASHANPALFFLVRFAAADPVLLSAFAVSVPNFAAALGRRTASPILLACWFALAVSTANPLLPVAPMAVIAAAYSPFTSPRYSRWLLAFLCVGIVVKASVPESPWGLNYRADTTQPAAIALSQYCETGSSNELAVIGASDHLYASVLPLHRLSYVVVGDVPQAGAVIGLHSEAELADYVRAHPSFDFFAADTYRDLLTNTSHDYAFTPNGYFFLRSRLRGSRIAATRTCKM